MKIKIQNLKISILDIFYFIGGVFSFFICLFFQKQYYETLMFLPILFNICFFLILIMESKKFLTVKIFIFCSFLRYVVLPFFQSVSPIYSFSSYYCSDSFFINKAVSLMCYEIVFISIFIIFYTKIHRKKFFIKQHSMRRIRERFPIEKNRYGAVFIFCVLAIGLGIMNPNVMKQISFIMIKSNSVMRVGQISATSNSLDMIIRQIFVIGLLSFFIISVVFLKQHLYITRRKIALNLSLIGALGCISVIIAEQRSSQIYCAFASIILLTQIFVKERRKILKIIISGVVIILTMLTVYKTFYAFNYDSYLSAISNSSSGIKDLVRTLEIYLLGPLSLSSAIEFKTIYQSIYLKQLLMDIGRSTIGISFLLKSSNFIMTSASYNLFVTAGRSESGYLLPITGQGYIFFDFLLSPILICGCLYLAFKLEKIMFSNKSAYVVYFSAYVFIRLATCIVSSNLNTVLNAISSIIISAGVVYSIQWLLNKINKREKLLWKRK